MVNSPLDVIDHSASDTVLTLREAIDVANSNSTAGLNAAELAQIDGTLDEDTIAFASGISTVTLTLDHLAISDSSTTTIDGGESGVTVQRSSQAGTPDFRIFDVFQGGGTAKADFVHLTIKGGSIPVERGAGIKTLGAEVNIVDCSVIGNNGLHGGGIYIDGGSATVADCHISNNTAASFGGLYNSGTLTLTNTVISNNTTTSNLGGLYNVGTMTILGATISGNTAGGVVGGLGNAGSMTISTSVISNNTTSSSYAGLYNSDTLSIEHSTISGNIATVDGGGVYNNGTMTANDVTISGNTAHRDGGGIHNAGTTTIANSTVSGNTANRDGGGVHNYDVVATISNCTITKNRADGDGEGGGTGGGLWTYNDAITFTTIKNTIVAGNYRGTGATADDIANKDLEAASTNNLIGDASSAGGLTNGINGNKVGLDPKLGPLAANGGPTQTHALLADSPARDAGDNAALAFVVHDQRGEGYARIMGSAVDIGAFELQMVDADANANVVAEGADFGVTVGVTAASTFPTGPAIDYFLLDDAGGRFAVNPATGVVMVADGSLIDVDSATSHSITVLASNGQGATATESFTINVVNAAPSSPVDDDVTPNSVPEGADLGTTVGITARSSDPGGGAVVYSLLNDAGGRFAIDATTGVVAVANGLLLNFESADNYEITVQAADPQGAKITASFSIDVTNVTPTTPVDGSLLPNSVGEGAGAGTLVGITASSVDPNGPTVVFSLVDDAGGRFAINAATGVVTVANGASLDFETTTSHTITIAASDGHGGTSTATFTIDIVNVAPTTPSDGDPTTNAVPEGAATGTVVGLTAISTDPNGPGIAYSLTNNAGGRFAIDGTTGVVTVADGTLLDADSATSHAIVVQASDGHGGVRQATFTIAVNRVNIALKSILGVNSLLFSDVGEIGNRVTLKLSANGADVIITDPNAVLTANVGTISDAGHTATVPRSLFPSGRIQINTQGGDDTITLDWTAGVVGPTGSGSIFINAGAGVDTVHIIGDDAAYIRVLTGLITSQATSSSIRRIPTSGRTRQHFLTNVEEIEVANVGTLDFLTRNGRDDVTYQPVDATRSRITGRSGLNPATGNPQPFVPVTWSNTTTLYLYAANGDSATTSNTVTILPNAFQTPGLKNFIYSGGAGVDSLDFRSAGDLAPATSGGQILFNGGQGTRDQLSVTGNTNFTLNNFRLTPSSGGFIRPVNVERVVIVGGGSANTIDASGFSGTAIIDGRGGNDIITGGAGRNILIGHIGSDTLTGGGVDDILIGGALAYSANGTEMTAIVDEWTTGASYATRVGNIKSGSGLANGAKISLATATDDGAIDTLKGNAGLDWFFAFGSDVLVDKLATELLR